MNGRGKKHVMRTLDQWLSIWRRVRVAPILRKGESSPCPVCGAIYTAHVNGGRMCSAQCRRTYTTAWKYARMYPDKAIK